MLSKELFVETLNLIKEKRSHERLLCDALENCCPGNYCDAFIYTEYENQVLKLLEQWLELGEDLDLLGFWCYDCDFGEKATPEYTEEYWIEKVDLTTPEKLYDYIVSKK